MIQDTPISSAGPLLRFDIRYKLLSALALTCAMAPIQTMAAALVSLLLGVLLLIIGRVRIREALRRLAPPNGFFAFVLIALVFTYPGHRWSHWTMVSIDGFWLGLKIAVKGNAMLCVLLTLVGTSTVPMVAHGLQQLGLPQKFVLLLAFSYRQIFITAEEFERRWLACTARCFTPRINMHTYRTIASLLAQTFVGSLYRARRIQNAMFARGFDGHFRSLEPAPPPGKAGPLFFILLLAVCCGITVLDRRWWA